MHARQTVTEEPYPQPFQFFILRQGLTEVPRQALNLPSSCLSLLSSWNDTQKRPMKKVPRLCLHGHLRVAWELPAARAARKGRLCLPFYQLSR